MSESSHKNDKPIVGITVGDYNGIGPEVIIKALDDNRLVRYVTPVIYGDGRIFTYYKKHFDFQNFQYHQTSSIDKIHHKKVNLIQLEGDEVEINPGHGDEYSGSYALTSLRKALEDLKSGSLHAITTAPLSKELIQSENFRFPGHTEYLTTEAGVSDSLMFLVSEELRVGVVTGHIPIREVSGAITQDLIKVKLDLMLQSLKKDFGIRKPRVAVLGLNPHAGENGLLGTEEKEIIDPVIRQFRDRGNLVFGPLPADGFFGSAQFRSFDGILAMYHDQGLIPFKSIAFESGVNFTAGLPFIRTSPDHGTAFSIAGKGTADETSMRNAILLAVDIIRSRSEME